MRKELDGNSGAVLALVANARAAAKPKIMAVADRCEEENRFRRKMYGLLTGVRPRGKRQKTQDVSFHNWAETQLAQAAECFFAALPNQNSDLSALHQFRIRGKQLRYSFELLASAFGPELRETQYPIVQELQEQLGQINDCVAADARLRRWRRKIDAPADLEVVDRLIVRQRVMLDESLAEYRAWWTPERSESLRQGLAALVGIGETTNHAATEVSEESALSQL
jgi:CHAD domain-containing protein